MKEYEKVLNKIESLKEDFKEMQSQPDYNTITCTVENFTLLLSGISACRKIPGIDTHMGYDKLYLCEREEDLQAVKEHLNRMYRIIDQQSLIDTCIHLFCTGEHFDQFKSFWYGVPVFDENQLSPEGKEAFLACREYTGHFRETVGNAGFYAWDASEQIGLMRLAYACGLLTEEEFWSKTRPIANRVAAVYNSWEEYAVACICGGAYFMFGESGRQEDNVEPFSDINIGLVRSLFFDNGKWRRTKWFSDDSKKKYHIPAQDILPLLQNWEGPQGCIATDRITVDGCKVGYMYREEPNPKMPDSGWRFFSGDESEEYVHNADNSNVYNLNTICNYDRDILPLLNVPVGTAYFRDEQGVLRKEKRSHKQS